MKKGILILALAFIMTSFAACADSADSDEKVEVTTRSASVNLNSDRQTAENDDGTQQNTQADNADYFALAQSCRMTAYCEAYKSGDYSSLTENERFVLDEASKVIDEYITADMQDFEKVHAIHDYMILNCTYDLDELDERKGADAYSFCPEGFFKNGKAVCSGYSSTFQLFMDLLDIPCITVENAYANEPGNDHAWNVVFVRGKWYYVDITWDDPVPDMNWKYHSFLLVNTNEMKSTGHIWDEDKYPYVENCFVRDWNCN